MYKMLGIGLAGLVALLSGQVWLGNFLGFGRQARSNRQIKQQSEDEKMVAHYCDYLLSDPTLNDLRVLNLRGVLKVPETSIQLKPYEKKITHSQRQVETITPIPAVGQWRRLVVLGDAGAGKTTLLRYLTLMSATGHAPGLPDLPVLISLPEFVRSRATRLLDYTFEQLERYMGERRAYLQDRLENGHILLLFDGLDEIQSDRDGDAQMVYQIVADQLSKLAKRYPRANIVVTCRRAGWRGISGDFVAYELVEFDWEDIQDFIRRWAAGRQRPEMFRPLATALLQSASVRALAANPFLLALICLVYEQRGMLPQRRSELYQWCVQVLLEAGDRKPGQLLNSLQKQALLRKIALHFHRAGQRDFPRTELLKVISPFLRELKLTPEVIARLLAELVSEQGVLREQGEGVYGFAHLSLQEYFVAEALAENQDYRTVAGSLHQAWWHEVIVLLTGLGDADAVLRMCIEAQGNRATLLNLACRCLANQPPVTNFDLAYAVLAEAMQTVLDIAVPVPQKAPVVEALSQIKDPLIVQYFSQLFAMRDVQTMLRWDLYARVILNLVQLGFAESYHVVFQLLHRAEIDADLKQKLIDAAVIVGEGDAATQSLREMLPVFSGDVRAKAILVLLQKGDFTLVPHAAVLLREKHIQLNLKRRLLMAIGNILPPAEFLKQTLPLLRDNGQTEPEIQMRALELAMRRGGNDAIIVLLNKLVEHPERFSPELRRRLLLLAGRFGGSDVVNHLLPLLDTERERTLERPAAISDTLKGQALAAIAALVSAEHVLTLRQWLRRQSRIDQYTQAIAILTRQFGDTPDTRQIVGKFLDGKRDNLKEMESQLRQLAIQTRSSMESIPARNSDDEGLIWLAGTIGSY